MKPLPFLHIRTPVVWFLQTVTNLLSLQVTFDIEDLLFLSPTEIPDARTSAPPPARTQAYEFTRTITVLSSYFQTLSLSI